MPFLIATVLILALRLPLHAQTTPVRTASADPGLIQAESLKTRLFALADDSMMGREAGTLGNWKATAYIAREFERFGLEPAGENGTFFQRVPLYRLAPSTNSTIVAEDAVLELGADFVPFGLSGTVDLDGVTTVYGGEATNQQGWISPELAAGHAVVMGYRGQRPINPLRFTTDPRFKDAVAVLVAELDLIPANFRERLLQGTTTTDSGGARSGPVAVLITGTAAEQLLGFPTGANPAGFAGMVIKGKLEARYTPTEYDARNVVGILRGSDPARNRQYVALTAHNDHTGMTRQPVDHDSLRAFNTVVRPLGADSPNRPPNNTESERIRTILDSLRRIHPPRPDSIFNGADDDGSGTVALLEIARSLARQPQRPRRSILFVSHTAEEKGLLGSRWYTDHPTVELDSIVAEIDEDMVGRGNATDLAKGGPGYLEVIGSRRVSREFGDILEQVNMNQRSPFEFDYEYDAPGHPLQYYCRADHYSYARYNIPSVAISRGEHMDYHQVTDEPSYIDYDALARVANLVRDAALHIANLDHRPVVDTPKRDPNAPCRQ